MIDGAGFEDLRKFISRRIRYARYRVGSTWTKVYLSEVKIVNNETVRIQINVNSDGNPITVNRVELFNNEAQLWAHQDCNVTLTPGQTGSLFWFDFTIREEVIS